MNADVKQAEELGLTKAASRLQGVSHITVKDVGVGGSDWHPGIELELESRSFAVLYQISRTLDKYHLRVYDVEGDNPERVLLTSTKEVEVSGI